MGSSMEHLDQLVVPADGKAVLKPMGTHLMLINPPSPVELGAKVPVTLKAKNGETFEFTIEVREEPQ